MPGEVLVSYINNYSKFQFKQYLWFVAEKRLGCKTLDFKVFDSKILNPILLMIPISSLDQKRKDD